ncbi:hypothetical protein [Kribbella flavida]|uniref:hypothetical protein n=1 Tax=Kribbella flavida TaxID=182640 RepID=UPI00019BE5C0|nr:hypothetical protein [Kribbella flavida]
MIRMKLFPAALVARDFIEAAGARLWKTAVDRAQGRLTSGSIDRYDDRPLYWARTTMSRAVREWQAPFPLTSLQRQAILRQFSYASRGIDQVTFAKNSTKLLVSRKDPRYCGAIRLRLGTGHPTLPGGHLHISALEYPTDASALTSPAFEADRKAVVDQTVALVEAAGKAVRR